MNLSKTKEVEKTPLSEWWHKPNCKENYLHKDRNTITNFIMLNHLSPERGESLY